MYAAVQLYQDASLQRACKAETVGSSLLHAEVVYLKLVRQVASND